MVEPFTASKVGLKLEQMIASLRQARDRCVTDLAETNNQDKASEREG